MKSCVRILAVVLVGILVSEFAAAAGICSAKYRSVTVARGGWVLVGLQLEAFDEQPFTVDELIGDQLPAGSMLSAWDPVSGKPINSTKGSLGWSNSSGLTLDRGAAFWLNVPASAPEAQYTVYWCGRIPTDASTVVPVAGKLNLITYPYPMTVKWSNTSLAKQSPPGTMIYTWDTAGQKYIMSTKMSSGWSGEEVTLPAGRGFWYRRGVVRGAKNDGSSGNTGSSTWTEPAPYNATGMSSFGNAAELASSFIAGMSYSSSTYAPAYYAASPYTSNLNIQVSSTVVGLTEYSDTNVREEGVGEVDIVKTDGQYIYAINGRYLHIVKANAPSQLSKMSKTSLGSIYAKGLYIRGDKLLVIASRLGDVYGYLYDVTSKSAPKLVKTVKMYGSYVDTRIINEHAYMIVIAKPNFERWYGLFGTGIGAPVTIPKMAEAVKQSFLNWAKTVAEGMLPACYVDGKRLTSYQVSDVGKIDGTNAKYFLCILGINMSDNTVKASTVAVESYSSYGSTVYCSKDNLYVAQKVSERYQKPGYSYYTYRYFAKISKFHLQRGLAGLIGSSKDQGTILNEYSLDEHDGNLRVAMTRTEGVDKNCLYVMDRSMKKIGSLVGINENENVRSVRFEGDRGYIVTFRYTDPFIILDLSNDKLPKECGNLEIPGFSTYLHPVDKDHIMGLGTIGSSKQLVLFSVKDINNPKVVDKEVLGRGTCAATYEPKAFVYDKARKQVILPFKSYSYSYSYSSSTTPKYKGAVILKVDPASGISYVGKIDHQSTSSSSYSYSSYSDTVLRCLYVGDTLFTVSGNQIQANRYSTRSYLTKYSMLTTTSSISRWCSLCLRYH